MTETRRNDRPSRRHSVGIHRVKSWWRAGCVSCSWEAPRRLSAREAQADAVEHGGGTLRNGDPRKELDPPSAPIEAPELFPGQGYGRRQLPSG